VKVLQVLTTTLLNSHGEAIPQAVALVKKTILTDNSTLKYLYYKKGLAP
jgi:hypothetical protein